MTKARAAARASAISAPYFPQDHYCDKPGAPATGRRANVIASLTGAEAILTGLAGIHSHPDGSTIHPQPVAEGTINLHNLIYRNRTIDLAISPDRYQVIVDGRILSPAPDGTVLAVPPRTWYSSRTS